jgi:hypothetical protein
VVPRAGPYAFLPACSEALAKQAVQICTDDQGLIDLRSIVLSAKKLLSFSRERFQENARRIES